MNDTIPILLCKRIPWWGWSLIAFGVLTLFGWMAWVKLPEIAVTVMPEAGVPPKYSLYLLEWLGPRAGKELMSFNTSTQNFNIKNQWKHAVKSVIGKAEVDPSECEVLIHSIKGNINVKDEEGNTYLMWAVDFNLKNVCEALIEAGADVNSENNSGRTPLHTCGLAYNRAYLANLLIQNKAELNRRDKIGFTPLDYAARCYFPMYGPLPETTAHFLFTNGAKTGEELDAEAKLSGSSIKEAE